MAVKVERNLIQPNPKRKTEVEVGHKIHALRVERGLSLRSLAERSGLNVNTLSMVENGKTSPSVSTLQQLAQALGVTITSFFESKCVQKPVVFTPHEERPTISFNQMQIENLGEDLSGHAVQPFVVTLKPGSASGERAVVHTGYEFVYCLSGSLNYKIESEIYLMKPGDSLLFEAHLPHCLESNGNENGQILLIFYPSDERDAPKERHFNP